MNKACKYDEISVPKLCFMAKENFEDTIKITNQLTVSQ